MLLYVIVLQVHNMSQSIDVLDQRTQRDLKFVEMMEVQIKNLEDKFKEVEDGHESKIARQYKVYLHSDCAFNINQQLNDVLLYRCLHSQTYVPPKKTSVICL